MLCFKNLFVLTSRKKRDIKQTLTTSFLVWLSLAGLMLFRRSVNKRTSKAKLSGIDKHLQPNNQRITFKATNCLDQNQLTCEVIQHQRENRAWVNSFYSKRANEFEGQIEVDTTEDEKKCPDLYRIAREILNGLKVKLPSETKNTIWKFRERVDLQKLKTTHLRWNHPWQQGNSKQTMELFRRYNVSARTIKEKKKLITYGHNCCNGSKFRAVEGAINNAKMDYAEALDLSTVSVPFQIAHQDILRMRRGAGYWLWKPYVILQALVDKLNDGDLLVYHDSGAYFNKDVGPLLKLCQEQKPSILTFTLATNFRERKWSKRDAFILMGMDDPIVQAADQEQRLANLIVAMKNCETIQYFMEFLAYAADPRINTDKKNFLGKPNLETFRENRHDQTVHSLLSKKWGILSLRDPCTCPRNHFDRRGKYASGPYKSLYVHDRNRD